MYILHTFYTSRVTNLRKKLITVLIQVTTHRTSSIPTVFLPRDSNPRYKEILYFLNWMYLYQLGSGADDNHNKQ